MEGEDDEAWAADEVPQEQKRTVGMQDAPTEAETKEEEEQGEEGEEAGAQEAENQ